RAVHVTGVQTCALPTLPDQTAPLEPTADAQAKVEFGSAIRTVDDRFSTFAIDVDTGSYTAARSALNNGVLPQPQNVRVEEFINDIGSASRRARAERRGR